MLLRIVIHQLIPPMELVDLSNLLLFNASSANVVVSDILVVVGNTGLVCILEFLYKHLPLIN